MEKKLSKKKRKKVAEVFGSTQGKMQEWGKKREKNGNKRSRCFRRRADVFTNTTPKKGFRQTHVNYEQKVKELSYSCAYRGSILLYTGEKKLYKALFTSQLENARSEKKVSRRFRLHTGEEAESEIMN